MALLPPGRLVKQWEVTLRMSDLKCRVSVIAPCWLPSPPCQWLVLPGKQVPSCLTLDLLAAALALGGTLSQCVCHTWVEEAGSGGTRGIYVVKGWGHLFQGTSLTASSHGGCAVPWGSLSAVITTEPGGRRIYAPIPRAAEEEMADAVSPSQPGGLRVWIHGACVLGISVQVGPFWTRLDS